jgi:hypothetical protein
MNNDPRDKKPQLRAGESHQSLTGANEAQSAREGKNGTPYQDRRNAAACFRNRNVGEPQYTGVMVIDGLSTGTKVWVNIGVRQVQRGRHAGQKYLSISLRPFKPEDTCR